MESKIGSQKDKRNHITLEGKSKNIQEKYQRLQ